MNEQDLDHPDGSRSLTPAADARIEAYLDCALGREAAAPGAGAGPVRNSRRGVPMRYLCGALLLSVAVALLLILILLLVRPGGLFGRVAVRRV